MTAEDGCRLVEEPGPLVHARLGQVLTGLIVGRSRERAACIDCGRRLSAGENVVAYAYWSEDAIDWAVCRLYCADCGPDGVGVPTLGLTEAIVTAELGVRELPGRARRWLCLYMVRLDRVSPPTQGAEP